MTSEQFILYAGSAIVAIVALYYFIQWSHQIARRNRLLEAQVKLLAKIAQKQGVSMDDIEVISRVAES